MTVEELIEKLQKIENKKSCVKVAINPYGCLKYEAICDVRVADDKERRQSSINRIYDTLQIMDM